METLDQLQETLNSVGDELGFPQQINFAGDGITSSGRMSAVTFSVLPNGKFSHRDITDIASDVKEKSGKLKDISKVFEVIEDFKSRLMKHQKDVVDEYNKHKEELMKTITSDNEKVE